MDPLYFSINTILNVSKNGPFLNPPTWSTSQAIASKKHDNIFLKKVNPIPSLLLRHTFIGSKIWHSNKVFEGLRFLPVGVCCFFAVDVVAVGDAVAVVAVAVVAPAVGNIVGVANATYGWLAWLAPVAEVGDAETYDGCGDAQSHFVDLHEPEKMFCLNFVKYAI